MGTGVSPVRGYALHFSRGRARVPTTIEEAARLAVSGCLPLAANRYKVQIATGLMRKALAELAV